MPRVVAAPDKLRGTASAAEVAAAVARAARAAGWECTQMPLSDGGEGFIDVVPGAMRSTPVTGALGSVVEARWRLAGRVAYVEMAEATGLTRVGGPEVNDPMAASTVGVGELILAAAAAGARTVVVGAGGSASTDGGLGAIEALAGRARGIDIVIACDVDTLFVDAATIFAEQKGASPAQVGLLSRRLERLAQIYRDRYGVDVAALPGGGAAGGLAGGLAAAFGAELVSGFEVVAELSGLADAIEGSDLVVTAEGFVDEESLNGKVVGGVAGVAEDLGVDLLVIAGQVYDGTGLPALSLVERFGEERAWADPLGCIESVALELLRSR